MKRSVAAIFSFLTLASPAFADPQAEDTVRALRSTDVQALGTELNVGTFTAILSADGSSVRFKFFFGRPFTNGDPTEEERKSFAEDVKTFYCALQDMPLKTKSEDWARSMALDAYRDLNLGNIKPPAHPCPPPVS